MLETIAGFVITYRRPQTLYRTLEAIYRQTRPPQEMWVVDNGNSRETVEVVSAFERYSVRYLPMSDNLGPAGAAAAGFRKVAQAGYEWVYWGDDDDPPRSEDTLARLARLIDRSRDVKLGAVGAVGARFDWRIGEFRRLADGDLRGDQDVDAIGGGQTLILNRRAVEAVGGPDAELFFGLEEMELCLRLRQAGYRLLVDGGLMHEYRAAAGRLGTKVKPSLLRSHELTSLWRRYYNTRNYIYLMRRRFKRPDLARREALKAVARCLVSPRHGLLYSLQLCPLQIRGVVHGYRGRLGRVVEPRAGARSPTAS